MAVAVDPKQSAQIGAALETSGWLLGQSPMQSGRRRRLRLRTWQVLTTLTMALVVVVVWHYWADVGRALRGLRGEPKVSVATVLASTHIALLKVRVAGQAPGAGDRAPGDRSSAAVAEFHHNLQALLTHPVIASLEPGSANARHIETLARLVADVQRYVESHHGRDGSGNRSRIGAVGPVDDRKHVSSPRDRPVDVTLAPSSAIDVWLEDAEAAVRAISDQALAVSAAKSATQRARLTMLVSALALCGFIVLLSLLMSMFALRRHVAELEKTTAELADSERNLSATVQSASDAIIVTSLDGTIVEFNRQASACFGYSRDEALGADVGDLIVPERMRAAHRTGMARFAEMRDARVIGKRIEIPAIHRDGYEFPIELALSCVERKDRAFVVAYARDISQRHHDEEMLRRANEQANAASRAKSRFLAIMSHEMRTPLNGILGLLQLLRETRLDKQQSRWLATASTSGEVLLDLINDVLDLSKLQAGKLELDPHVFDLKALVESLAEIIAPDAKRRGNHIVIAYPADLATLFVGDGKRLRQVLLNLIANANKFTADGEIAVSTAVMRQVDDRVVLQISVSDTGIGIPADRLSSLFNEFTTLDNGYSRREAGTGLGLAISKHIIELFGGSIHVESTVGFGSQFWIEFELPIAAPGATVVPVPPEPSCTIGDGSAGLDCRGGFGSDVDGTTGGTVEAAGLGRSRALRVLVAEDNATNTMVTTAFLERAGHRVVCVGDGRAAVAEIAKRVGKHGAIDVVLMDISMPGMDGMEATRQIRAMGGPLSTLPIIALTAHAQPEHQEEIRRAGMSDVLTKPVRKDELLKAISRHASGRARNDQGDVEGVFASAVPETASTLVDDQQLDALISEIGKQDAPILVGQFMADIAEITAAYANVGDLCGGRDLCDGLELPEKTDFAEIRSTAHRLAGCAATLGAVRLAEQARLLEQAAQDGDADHVARQLHALPAVQAATLKVLTAHLRESCPVYAQAHRINRSACDT